MKKYMFVKSESLVNIANCFSTQEEFQNFCNQLGGIVEEIVFAGKVADRNIEDENLTALLTLKQIFLFTVFCRENIEIIHDMISQVQYKEVSEQERKALLKKDPTLDLDQTG